MATEVETTTPHEAVKLNTPVNALPGIGKARAARFRRLGIHRVSELIQHLPMRYEFEHAEGTIADLPMEGIGSARGTVVVSRWVPGGKRGRFQVTLQDHSDRLDLVWFNAAYLRDKIFPGMAMRVQGKVGAFNGYPQMVNPKWERIDDEDCEPGDVRTNANSEEQERYRPIYPSTEGLSSNVIEQTIADVLPLVVDQLSDPLPQAFVAERSMPVLCDAFRQLHQPAHEEEAATARRRLAFNELLLLQLGMAVKRRYNDTSLIAPALHWSDAIHEHICARFPFELTDGQAKVITEMASDLQRDRPMNRLVQGDVGSGKTVIALYAMLMAVADRKQGALMAPTELLAEQHYRSIGTMLEDTKINLALLTASAKVAERNDILEGLQTGSIDIVVGTQSLVSDAVQFKELAVIVVDEQHRFGVRQRAALRSRGESTSDSATETPEPSEPPTDPPQRLPAPHCLVMTATPIPRTLSLTVFGDLDVSTIRGLPPGRTPITTRVVGPEKTPEVYAYLNERLDRGEQAYVVVPAIDESSDDVEKRLVNVTSHAQLLQEKYCKDHVVAAVHGRLKRDDRESIMTRFREGEIDVLVATTVIEVGVDVPNATVMVVEHAERFGLSQLHQLRGRIGRGTSGSKPLCVFVADPTTDGANDRMKAIAGTTDGFKIAEADLNIRGMGDFFGTRQHGLPPLRVAAIPEHMDLLQMARRDAITIIDNDPLLDQPDHELLCKILLREYGETLGLIDVG